MRKSPWFYCFSVVGGMWILWFALRTAVVFCQPTDIVQPAATQPATGRSDGEAGVPTVAILPFHCRAGRGYEGMAPAVAMICTRRLTASGRAVVVERESVSPFLEEKTLARGGLADKPTLAKRGSVIGADFILWGTSDVINGKLVLHGELIPTHRHDYDKLHQKYDRNYIQIDVTGPERQRLKLLEEFAEKVCDSLPAKNETPPTTSPTSVPSSQPAETQTVAVFDFTAMPGDRDTYGLAGVLTDLMHMKMGESLSMETVSRKRINDLLREKKLALAELTHRTRALCAARWLGADVLLLGNVVRTDGRAQLNVELIDTRTGVVAASAAHTGQYDNVDEFSKDAVAALARDLPEGPKRLALARSHQTNRKKEAEAHAHRAWGYLFNKQLPYEKRVSECRKLLKLGWELDDHNSMVLTIMGCLEKNHDKNYPQAVEYLEEAVRIDPKQHHAYRFLAQVWFYDLKNPKRALPYIRKAVALTDKTHWLYRQILAEILRELHQLEEAEKYARIALICGKGTSTRHTLAKILEARGKYAEAADAYYCSAPQMRGRDVLRKARELWEKVGDTNNAIKALEKLVETRMANYQERLELAEYLKESNPTRAATICYLLMEEAEEEFLQRQAKQLLKNMGWPEEYSRPTSAVFDIEELRKKNKFLYYQIYEGYRYPQFLMYLKAYVEDIIGVPVHMSKNQRSIPKIIYNRTRDTVFAGDVMWNELKGIRKQQGALSVIGLISQNLKNSGGRNWGVFWNDTPVAILSTNMMHHTDRYTDFPDSVRACKGHMIGVMKYSALQSLPLEYLRKQCASGICALRAANKYFSHPPELAPCLDCREMMHRARLDWPKGKPRPPIQAGPAEPAVQHARGKVLLVPVGSSAENLKLSGAAKAIQRSLGLPTEIHAEIPVPPNLQRDKNGYCSPAELCIHTPELKGLDQKYAAIIVVTRDKVWNFQAGGMWQAHLPNDPKGQVCIRCPGIVLCLERLPRPLRGVETFPARQGENEESFETPRYAKVLVGGLAMAALKDHQCWTYGCPATIWEKIGVPNRCSYWLCPKCRQAVVKYYGLPKTPTSPPASQPTTGK